MDERTHASYLSDLDFFQTQLESTSNPFLYLPVAMLNVRMGNFAEAISFCNAGAKVYPAYHHLNVIKSEALINTGRKDEAREILFDIVVMDEDNFKALKLLGLICKTDGDKKGAVMYLRAAFMKAPEDVELLTWLEELGGLPIPTMKDIEEASGVEDFTGAAHDDLYTFDVEGMIEEAKGAISELMDEMNKYKSAGKTINDMLSDDAAAEEAAKSEEEISASLRGEGISDDEILSALSAGEAETAKRQASVDENAAIIPTDMPESAEIPADEEPSETSALFDDFQAAMQSLTKTIKEASKTDEALDLVPEGLKDALNDPEFMAEMGIAEGAVDAPALETGLEAGQEAGSLTETPELPDIAMEGLGEDAEPIKSTDDISLFAPEISDLPDMDELSGLSGVDGIPDMSVFDDAEPVTDVSKTAEDMPGIDELDKLPDVDMPDIAGLEQPALTDESATGIHHEQTAERDMLALDMPDANEGHPIEAVSGIETQYTEPAGSGEPDNLQAEPGRQLEKESELPAGIVPDAIYVDETAAEDSTAALQAADEVPAEGASAGIHEADDISSVLLSEGISDDEILSSLLSEDGKAPEESMLLPENEVEGGALISGGEPEAFIDEGVGQPNGTYAELSEADSVDMPYNRDAEDELAEMYVSHMADGVGEKINPDELQLAEEVDYDGPLDLTDFVPEDLMEQVLEESGLTNDPEEDEIINSETIEKVRSSFK